MCSSWSDASIPRAAAGAPPAYNVQVLPRCRWALPWTCQVQWPSGGRTAVCSGGVASRALACKRLGISSAALLYSPEVNSSYRYACTTCTHTHLPPSAPSLAPAQAWTAAQALCRPAAGSRMRRLSHGRLMPSTMSPARHPMFQYQACCVRAGDTCSLPAQLWELRHSATGKADPRSPYPLPTGGLLRRPPPTWIWSRHQLHTITGFHPAQAWIWLRLPGMTPPPTTPKLDVRPGLQPSSRPSLPAGMWQPLQAAAWEQSGSGSRRACWRMAAGTPGLLSATARASWYRFRSSSHWALSCASNRLPVTTSWHTPSLDSGPHNGTRCGVGHHAGPPTHRCVLQVALIVTWGRLQEQPGSHLDGQPRSGNTLCTAWVLQSAHLGSHDVVQRLLPCRPSAACGRRLRRTAATHACTAVGVSFCLSRTSFLSSAAGSRQQHSAAPGHACLGRLSEGSRTAAVARALLGLKPGAPGGNGWQVTMEHCCAASGLSTPCTGRMSADSTSPPLVTILSCRPSACHDPPHTVMALAACGLAQHSSSSSSSSSAAACWQMMTGHVTFAGVKEHGKRCQGHLVYLIPEGGPVPGAYRIRRWTLATRDPADPQT